MSSRIRDDRLCHPGFDRLCHPGFEMTDHVTQDERQSDKANAGHLGIDSKLLKLCKKEIIKFLCFIINLSFRECLENVYHMILNKLRYA